MKKTYRGSCHCGAVRFESDVDLAEGTSRCNCSICSKARFWKAIVKAADFRLLDGRDVLREYLFGSHTIHHFFCGRCGVKVFGRGDVEALGGEFYAINVAALDDVTPEELGKIPISFEDGRNDNWGATPAEVRYL
jgi:hypothetical protein